MPSIKRTLQSSNVQCNQHFKNEQFKNYSKIFKDAEKYSRPTRCFSRIKVDANSRTVLEDAWQPYPAPKIICYWLLDNFWPLFGATLFFTIRLKTLSFKRDCVRFTCTRSVLQLLVSDLCELLQILCLFYSLSIALQPHTTSQSEYRLHRLIVLYVGYTLQPRFCIKFQNLKPKPFIREDIFQLIAETGCSNRN